MKRQIMIVVCCLFVAAVAFAKTNFDWDKTADFSIYKTYTWAKVQTPSTLWDQRVVAAIDAQLQAKGWTKMEAGGDVAVFAIGTTKDQASLNTYYDGWGGGWGYRGFGGMGMTTATTRVSTYKVGTLIVDLYDAKSKQLLWRGQASDTLSDKPEKNEKKMNKEVTNLFKKFPPGSAEK